MKRWMESLLAEAQDAPESPELLLYCNESEIMGRNILFSKAFCQLIIFLQIKQMTKVTFRVTCKLTRRITAKSGWPRCSLSPEIFPIISYPRPN